MANLCGLLKTYSWRWSFADFGDIDIIIIVQSFSFFPTHPEHIVFFSLGHLKLPIKSYPWVCFKKSPVFRLFFRKGLKEQWVQHFENIRNQNQRGILRKIRKKSFDKPQRRWRGRRSRSRRGRWGRTLWSSARTGGFCCGWGFFEMYGIWWTYLVVYSFLSDHLPQGQLSIVNWSYNPSRI